MLYPQALTATTKILRWLGFHVEVWKATYCCGQPAWNAGATHSAHRLYIELLQWVERTRTPVVIPSASCAGFLKGQARERAPRAFPYLFEVCHFLHEHGFTDRFPRMPEHETVILHNSCSALREYQLDDIPARLLAHCGFTLVEPEKREQCCGFGGTFSVKFIPISIAMGQEKLNSILNCKGIIVASADWSCLMHLRSIADNSPQAQHLRFMYVCELIWQAIEKHG